MLICESLCDEFCENLWNVPNQDSTLVDKKQHMKCYTIEGDNIEQPDSGKLDYIPTKWTVTPMNLISIKLCSDGYPQIVFDEHTLCYKYRS